MPAAAAADADAFGLPLMELPAAPPSPLGTSTAKASAQGNLAAFLEAAVEEELANGGAVSSTNMVAAVADGAAAKEHKHDRQHRKGSKKLAKQIDKRERHKLKKIEEKKKRKLEEKRRRHKEEKRAKKRASSRDPRARTHQKEKKKQEEVIVIRMLPSFLMEEVIVAKSLLLRTLTLLLLPHCPLMLKPILHHPPLLVFPMASPLFQKKHRHRFPGKIQQHCHHRRHLHLCHRPSRPPFILELGRYIILITSTLLLHRHSQIRLHNRCCCITTRTINNQLAAAATCKAV